MGLEETLYRVSESAGAVEVCLRAVGASPSCPSSDPLQVSLWTDSQSAGILRRRKTTKTIIVRQKELVSNEVKLLMHFFGSQIYSCSTNVHAFPRAIGIVLQ